MQLIEIRDLARLGTNGIPLLVGPVSHAIYKHGRQSGSTTLYAYEIYFYSIYFYRVYFFRIYHTDPCTKRGLQMYTKAKSRIIKKNCLKLTN